MLWLPWRQDPSPHADGIVTNATCENKIKDGINSGVKGSLDSPNVGRNKGGL